MDLQFNYGLLKERIKDEFGTFESFANALGISNIRLSRMLNGRADWPPKMAYHAAELVGLIGNIENYFFTPKCR